MATLLGLWQPPAVAERGEEWLAALRAGDEAEVESLADMRDFIRRSLAKGFGAQLGESDLDDLTQDTWLRVHRKHGSFRGNSRFRTWVAAVAVNTALGELRRRRHVHLGLDTAIAAGEALLQSPEAPARLQAQQRSRLLRAAIDNALTARQREALLAELGGLPLVEVARRLESPRGAVYKLLHDARKRLRSHLEAQGVGPPDLLFESSEVSP